MNNKIFGREIMIQAERHNLVAPEQYGSRKGHSAVAHALNKQLAYSLVRVLRSPAAMCSNDAQGCYDRIVHSVAALSMRRVGVPPEPIVSMFTTLQQLQHYVRTAYGDSQEALRAAEVHPVAIQGVGQGNGAAPQMWALVSTILLNMLRNAGFGARFISPLSHESVFYAAFSFVDDTDLLLTDAQKFTSAQEVAQAMQQALDHWEGVLRATGGALAPLKSHWYLIDFRWDAGGWQYVPLQASRFPISIRDGQGVRQELEQVDCSEARRTLGVYLAPDGDATTQFTVLLDRARVWADNIRTNHLSRKYAWQAMTSVIVPQLAYPLATSTMTRAQCAQIDTVIRRAVLPQGGVVRNFPLALAYGSVGHEGLGLLRLWDHQGLAALQMFFRAQLGPSTFLSQQLQILLELHQLEAGTPFSLFEAEYGRYQSLVTETWVKNLWRYVSQAGICVSGGTCLARKREGDKFLMPQWVQRYHGQELRQINHCRMFLQVLTLADVVTTDGTRISAAAWTGDEGGEDPLWPRQVRPTAAAWHQWREALVTSFGIERHVSALPLATNRHLAERLGWWYSSELFEWEFHPMSGCLFQTGDVVRQFVSTGGRTSRGQMGSFVLTAEGVQLPAGTVPASVTLVSDLCGRLEGISGRTPLPEESRPAWYDQMEVHLPFDQGTAFAQAMIDGEAVAVTDGSFKDQFGTAAGILEGRDSTTRIRLLLVVPGCPEQQSALRSELMGLLAVVRWASAFAEAHEVDTGSVKVACDNLAAVRAADSYSAPVNPHSAHFDIVSILRSTIRRSKVRWSFEHVKGHSKGPNLSRLQRLNVTADQECKRFWQQSFPHYLLDQAVHEKEWSVRIGERKICSRLVPSLVTSIQDRSAAQYWRRRAGPRATLLVDWDATAAAVKSLPRSRQIWLAKQSSGMCATGRRMHAWGKRSSAQCPRCSEEEDSEHVLCCQGVGTDARWAQHMESLRRWMEQEESAPQLIDDLVEGLQQWRGLSSVQRSLHNTLRKTDSLPGINSSSQKCNQHYIGWRAALEGRLARDWGIVQQRFWITHGILKSVRRWKAALIHRLLQIAWDLWTHRNFVLHQSEEALSEYIVDLRLGELFHLPRDQVPQYLHSLLRGSLASLRRHPLPYKMDWLSCMEAGVAMLQQLG
jgi:hypothetical protein